MVTGNFTRRSAGLAELRAKSVQISTNPSFFFEILVRARGLEPLILAEPDPKSGVSAIPPRAPPAQLAVQGAKSQAAFAA